MALPNPSGKAKTSFNTSTGGTSSISSPGQPKAGAFPTISAFASDNCSSIGPRARSKETKNGQTAGGMYLNENKPVRVSASVPKSSPNINNGGNFSGKNLATTFVGSRSVGNSNKNGSGNSSAPKPKPKKSTNVQSKGGRNNRTGPGKGNVSRDGRVLRDIEYGPASRYDSLPRQNTDTPFTMVSDNVQGYTATLANPKENMFRVPDSSIDPTALVRSIRTYEIETFFSGSADDGKFSIAVQPKPGNIDDPSHYQSLIVDASNGWPTGKFADGDSYLQTTDKSGDPRLDSNWQTLFSQPTGLYVVSGIANDKRIFGGTPNVQGASYGLQVQYNATTGAFTLPPGAYLFTIQNSSSNIDATEVNASSTVLYEELLNSNYSSSYIVSASPNADTFIPFYPQTTPPQSFLSYVTVSPVTSEGIFSSANYGNVTQLRPVGLSLLCSFTGTEFSDGGRIAIGLMRPGSLTTQFLTDNPVQGNQLQEVETLGTIPGTYNGVFKKGVYSYWLPMDKVKDLAFYAPDDCNAFTYPYLVASGQLSTTATVTQNVVATIRAEVCVVFEFQTQASMWEQLRCYGDDARMNMALMMFMNQPNAMQNDQHAKWIQFLLRAGRKALDFYNRNKDPIQAIFQAGLLIAGI